MDRTFLILALLGTAALVEAAWPQAAKQQPAQQARPAQAPARIPAQTPTHVPAHVSAGGQLNAAAQGPGQAARVFDGGRVTAPARVQVQPSTTTVNAAAIAARENAAEKARQAAESRKRQLDNHPVPAP
jgi:hypothetical protein